jgi:hypothetical protein
MERAEREHGKRIFYVPGSFFFCSNSNLKNNLKLTVTAVLFRVNIRVRVRVRQLFRWDIFSHNFEGPCHMITQISVGILCLLSKNLYCCSQLSMSVATEFAPRLTVNSGVTPILL